jgi:hypothetical protein
VRRVQVPEAGSHLAVQTVVNLSSTDVSGLEKEGNEWHKVLVNRAS